jgi:hypothetical protein
MHMYLCDSQLHLAHGWLYDVRQLGGLLLPVNTCMHKRYFTSYDQMMV